MYTPLTYSSLETAKQARDKLRESERKAELYRLYRDPKDPERTFIEKFDLPMSRFLYNFSTFNFMNFRRLDRFYFSHGNNINSKKENPAVHYTGPATKDSLYVTGGLLSLFSVLVSLDKVVGLAENSEGLEKAAVITADSALLVGGAFLLYKGLKAIKNNKKEEIN
jgi:hypothetical protein